VEQIPEHIESIVTALFSGEATDTEVNALREWVDASVSHCDLLDEYRRTHYLVRSYGRENNYDSDEAWKKLTFILRNTSFARRARLLKRAGRSAAIFILAFGAGVATMYFSRTPGKAAPDDEASVSFTEYTVPYGSKSKITLPDSSSIWLNAGSKLRYGSTFNQSDREVSVEGEAYFQVARNEQKPFFVKTSAVTLKVLGTSFNIKAYPEENNVETTVETGSVQVLRNVEGQLTDRLILTAGQKATVVKSGRADSMAVTTPSLPSPASVQKTKMPEKVAEKTIVAKNVPTELYTSWKDTRWLVNKEPLEKLAVSLERRYNIQIAFTDEQLKQFSFSGTFENETLEQVLEAIKLSAPIEYTVKQNRVKLSRNKWISKNK
jgi:ferric-dicitrate binding protein FerR (iron transport regulator)